MPTYLSAPRAAPKLRLEFTDSQQFMVWLAEQTLSLGFTTYRAGKFFLIGLQDRRLSAFARAFERFYQGGLWLLNLGTGKFGQIDVATGKFEAIAFCPGYLRGLTFAGDFAVVGLSQSRGNKTFAELPLEDRLQAKQATPRCGLSVIDLRSGDVAHSLRTEGVVEELYDMVTLPHVRRPQAIGIRSDEIRRVLRVAGE